MKIKMERKEYDKMLAHAKEEFPKEACGLIAGFKAEDFLTVMKIYQLENLDDSAQHYSMAPEEQFKVVKEIRKLDYELIANYHSHPYTPARPSEEDKRLAYDDNLVYFILSLKDKIPELKAFKIKEQSEVEEVKIIIL